MVGEYLTLDKFLHSTHISGETLGRSGPKRTLIVNRLYGNIRGIKLKKLSLYSFNLIALSATAPRTGRIPGGNLPFGSQFSVKHIRVKYRVSECRLIHTFRDGQLELFNSGFEVWMEWELRYIRVIEERHDKIGYTCHTYDVYDSPLLLPIRTLPRNSRPPLSTRLFFFF